ncbi:MAG: hypothetical protein LBB82_10430, partial [Treponema sp.]|nr:hypothetical protein [Treponema sp.]
LTVLAAWFVIPVSPAVSAEASRRPPGIASALMAGFIKPSPYVPFASIGGSVIYSFITIILIYYYFEKTHSPEIIFVAFFVLSFSMEAMRAAVPLGRVFTLPGLYLLTASRFLLFGRYFGIISLFAASVYAAGLEVQKQRNTIFIIIVSTLVIALGVPIDVLSWDSSFSMISGYAAMFRMTESGIFLITIVSFLISAYSRGSKEFIFIGIGSFLAFLGRMIFLNADTWPGMAGLAILSAGTWIICDRLHRVYLWL